MLQLSPPLVLNTPKGKAVAHFLLDYGYEHDLLWVCFQHDTGECWTWSNKDITIDSNSSIGRHKANNVGKSNEESSSKSKSNKSNARVRKR